MITIFFDNESDVTKNYTNDVTTQRNLHSYRVPACRGLYFRGL